MKSWRVAGGYPLLEEPVTTVFKVDQVRKMAAGVYFEASINTYESDVIKQKPKIFNIIVVCLA
jgi:hypothetical protein